MKEVIIFGTGGFWNNWKTNLKKEYHILAFCDSDAKNEEGRKFYDGIEVIPPSKLETLNFDKIVIASSYFVEIIEQLFQLGISSKKIEILNCFVMTDNETTSINVLPDKSIEYYMNGKVKFRCETATDTIIARDIFGDGGYNFNTTDNSVAVIDIGTNIGIAALYFAQYENVKKVYGFEPVYEIYKKALSNFALNDVEIKEKFELYNFALGNHEESINFKYNGGMLHLNEKINAGQEAASIIEYKDAAHFFKKILEKHIKEHIVLKCDCEGGEYEIFDTLHKGGYLQKIDTILMEYHDYDNLNEKVIEEYLREDGFDYIRICTKINFGIYMHSIENIDHSKAN